MFLVGQVSGLVKNFNIGIFSDITNVINVKLCMMYCLLSFTCLLHFRWLWHYFKITAVSESFNRNFFCSHPIKLKLCRIVKYIKQVMNIYHYFWLSQIFKGDDWCVSWLEKSSIVGFFKDTVQAKFFKLLGVFQFVSGLVTLILFQGHRCVRMINC